MNDGRAGGQKPRRAAAAEPLLARQSFAGAIKKPRFREAFSFANSFESYFAITIFLVRFALSLVK
jgi:hypothetical protein